MSSLQVDNIQTYNSNPPVIKNVSGTEVGKFCRAWVNFNGTGTVAIRQSFNVSSITDNGTGSYTISFTTAMVDANYAAVGHCATETDVGNTNPAGVVDRTTADCRVDIETSAGAQFDTALIDVVVFR